MLMVRSRELGFFFRTQFKDTSTASLMIELLCPISSHTYPIGFQKVISKTCLSGCFPHIPPRLHFLLLSSPALQ